MSHSIWIFIFYASHSGEEEAGKGELALLVQRKIEMASSLH